MALKNQSRLAPWCLAKNAIIFLCNLFSRSQWHKSFSGGHAIASADVHRHICREWSTGTKCSMRYAGSILGGGRGWLPWGLTSAGKRWCPASYCKDQGSTPLPITPFSPGAPWARSLMAPQTERMPSSSFPLRESPLKASKSISPALAGRWAGRQGFALSLPWNLGFPSGDTGAFGVGFTWKQNNQFLVEVVVMELKLRNHSGVTCLVKITALV